MLARRLSPALARPTVGSIPSCDSAPRVPLSRRAAAFDDPIGWFVVFAVFGGLGFVLGLVGLWFRV